LFLTFNEHCTTRSSIYRIIFFFRISNRHKHVGQEFPERLYVLLLLLFIKFVDNQILEIWDPSLTIGMLPMHVSWTMGLGLQSTPYYCVCINTVFGSPRNRKNERAHMCVLIFWVSLRAVCVSVAWWVWTKLILAVYVCSVLLIRVSVLMLSRCVFGQECLGLSHGGGSWPHPLPDPRILRSSDRQIRYPELANEPGSILPQGDYGDRRPPKERVTSGMRWSSSASSETWRWRRLCIQLKQWPLLLCFYALWGNLDQKSGVLAYPLVDLKRDQ